MSDPSRSDAEIIEASLHDPSPFGEIFARHQAAVFRFVARRIGFEDAADVTADIFVRAFSIRHRYDLSKDNSLPWLYGIATNLLGDRHRRMRRGWRVHLAVSRHNSVADETSDIDDRLVAQQVAARLNASLRRLSRMDRETLLLFALEGLTYAEIARALEIPIGTVGSRIARARRQIIEQIPDLRQITGSEGSPDG